MSKPVILIFSIYDDAATTEVMRWLHRSGRCDVVRINSDEVAAQASVLRISGETFSMTVKGREFALEDLQAVWYRKGEFWFRDSTGPVDIEGHAELSEALTARVASESQRVRDYVHHLIAHRVPTLAHARIASLNKLIVLDEARAVGLHVPEFHVSNDTEWLFDIASRQPMITKAMSNGVYLWDFAQSQRAYFSYTERVTPASFDGLPQRIPLSFVQREVTKALELRIFHLDGQLFPIAIFSQADEQTRVDHRKYNYERPNRTVPYALPSHVAERVLTLFRRLGLNTGSVDMMLGEDGNYYFLEINPAGQYDALSRACNFDIGVRIAQWLEGDREHRDRAA